MVHLPTECLELDGLPVFFRSCKQMLVRKKRQVSTCFWEWEEMRQEAQQLHENVERYLSSFQATYRPGDTVGVLLPPKPWFCRCLQRQGQTLPHDWIHPSQLCPVKSNVSLDR
jgi:hypothetical protein